MNKIMTKLSAAAVAGIVTVSSFAPLAGAYERPQISTKASSSYSSSWSGWGNGSWGNWNWGNWGGNGNGGGSTTTPTVDPKVPQSVEASFKVKGPYSMLDDHLYVEWDEVADAVSYEVMLGADKNFSESAIYDSSATCFLIYVKNDQWAEDGKYVKVRSVFADGSKSNWSKAIQRSTNALFR